VTNALAYYNVVTARKSLKGKPQLDSVTFDEYKTALLALACLIKLSQFLRDAVAYFRAIGF
jgi:hypothetical protein